MMYVKPHFTTGLYLFNLFFQTLLYHTPPVNELEAWQGLVSYLTQLLKDCNSIFGERLHAFLENRGARSVRCEFLA